jgi:hypothetical protein
VFHREAIIVNDGSPDNLGSIENNGLKKIIDLSILKKRMEVLALQEIMVLKKRKAVLYFHWIQITK